MSTEHPESREEAAYVAYNRFKIGQGWNPADLADDPREQDAWAAALAAADEFSGH